MSGTDNLFVISAEINRNHPACVGVFGRIRDRLRISCETVGPGFKVH